VRTEEPKASRRTSDLEVMQSGRNCETVGTSNMTRSFRFTDSSGGRRVTKAMVHYHRVKSENVMWSVNHQTLRFRHRKHHE